MKKLFNRNNNQINQNKQELLNEFFELLRRNNTDEGSIERFSNPQWQEKVTIDNLKILIEKEKEYAAIKERNYKLVVSDLLESLEEDSVQREKQIRELIDLFLEW